MSLLQQLPARVRKDLLRCFDLNISRFADTLRENGVEPDPSNEFLVEEVYKLLDEAAKEDRPRRFPLTTASDN